MRGILLDIPDFVVQDVQVPLRPIAKPYSRRSFVLSYDAAESGRCASSGLRLLVQGRRRVCNSARGSEG